LLVAVVVVVFMAEAAARVDSAPEVR